MSRMSTVAVETNRLVISRRVGETRLVVET